MTSSNEKIPAGMDGLIPHLVCDSSEKALAFYQKAFGAETMSCMKAPDGRRVMHAAMRIGKSIVFLADDFPEYCGGRSQTPIALKGTPVTIHRYVEDVDAAIQQAADAGATVIMPAADMFWGDRYGVVQDPFGHKWSIATHQKDMTPDGMQAAMVEAFAQMPQ